MAYYYLKLYHEILDDPKMGMLPDHLYRRVIEVFLIASASHDRDGFLPSVVDMAWKLRTTPDELLSDLSEIEKTGIIKQVNGCWHVTNFVKRQAAVTGQERTKRYREREQVSNETLQNRHTELKLNIDIESDKELDAKRIPAVTAPAPASFSHFTLLDAERLYRNVTGQITIPPRSSNGDGSNDYLESLLTISAAYDDPAKMLDDGKRHFAKWTNTRGKNGAFYKKTNPGWVSWWLDELAPRPQAPEPIRFDVPAAICGIADGLKRQAEQDPVYYGDKLREHIRTCDFCSGKQVTKAEMPDDVKQRMKEILGRKAIK